MNTRFPAIAGAAFSAYLMLAEQPSGWPHLARLALALCALGPALALWLRPPQPDPHSSPGAQRADWSDRATLPAIAALLAGAFLWLLSAAPEPLDQLGLTLEETLRPARAAERQQRQSAQTANSGGNWLWDGASNRPLPHRANLVPGTRPEVFVVLRDAADSASLLRRGVYLRAFVLTHYHNAAWSPGNGENVELKADASGLIHLGPASGRSIAHEVFHAQHPARQDVFTALQGAVAAQIPTLNRVDEDLLMLPPPAGDSGYHYLAASVPLNLNDLPPGGGQRPAAVNAGLSAPPRNPELARRVEELARRVAGDGTLLERLGRIRAFLIDQHAYSLRYDNPRGLDPLENFLFDERRGHCELFATAGALMARAIGVPARVAYGWNGGTYYSDSKTFVFRAREAHAWPEVKLEGLGWAVFDTTPSGAQRNNTPALARPGEHPPGPDSAEETEEGQEDAVPPEISRAWLLLPLPPALVLLLWRHFHRRRREIKTADAGTGLPPAPNYFTAWRLAAARRGWPMPPSATLRTHLARVGDAAPFGAELLHYHYGTRYGGARRDPRTERRLHAAIRKWEAEAPTTGD